MGNLLNTDIKSNDILNDTNNTKLNDTNNTTLNENDYGKNNKYLSCDKYYKDHMFKKTNECFNYFYCNIDDCFESNPCQHYVEYIIDDENSYKGYMSSDDIYDLCVLYNEPIPLHIKFEYDCR